MSHADSSPPPLEAPSPARLAPPGDRLDSHVDIALRWIGRLVDTAVIGIGATLIVLVLLNVVLHMLSRDLAWVTELGEFMMVWVTFLGGVSAAQRNAHMTITELLDKLDPERRRWADAVIQSACLCILAMLAVFGWRVVDNSWGSVLTTLDWPMAWQYLPLPLSAALMMLFLGRDLWLILRGVPREQRYVEE